MERKKINLEEKLSLIVEKFSPKTVATLNDHEVKLVKSEGPFTWHVHDNTDELFYLLKGKLAIRYRDKDIILNPGEMHVVPKGIEHTTDALVPCETLMIELKDTKNTGDKENEFTAKPENI